MMKTRSNFPPTPTHTLTPTHTPTPPLNLSLHRIHAFTVLTLLTLFILSPSPAAENLAPFTTEGDIGNPAKPGSCTLATSSNSWLVAGGGANMWFTNDAFHFVSKTISGDFLLRSGIELDWPKPGANAHRKACLMIRQSLDSDSAYVDVAIHGDGLISLQYRESKGGPTHEIQVRPSQGAVAASRMSPPMWAALQRQGDVFIVSHSVPHSLEKTPGYYDFPP